MRTGLIAAAFILGILIVCSWQPEQGVGSWLQGTAMLPAWEGVERFEYIVLRVYLEGGAIHGATLGSVFMLAPPLEQKPRLALDCIT